ncbi:MAG: twin-arginine translocation signal domain-containing protein, partial [Mesorhizobium sp.]
MSDAKSPSKPTLPVLSRRGFMTGSVSAAAAAPLLAKSVKAAEQS